MTKKAKSRRDEVPRHLDGRAVRSGLENINEIIENVTPPPALPRPPAEAMPIGHMFRGDVEAIARMRRMKKTEGGARTWEADYKPTPDWVVQFGDALATFFALCFILGSCAVIVCWGTFLSYEVVTATLFATIAGILVNLVLFESVKCVIFAMVALVAHDTLKREKEVTSRRARMALKAQALSRKSKFDRNKARVFAPSRIPYFAQ
jgi:hypothetical protein